MHFPIIADGLRIIAKMETKRAPKGTRFFFRYQTLAESNHRKGTLPLLGPLLGSSAWGKKMPRFVQADEVFSPFA